jgi:hypothetical protein
MISLFICSTIPVAAQRGGLGVFRTRTSVVKLKEFPPKPEDAAIEILGSKPKDRKHVDVCIINAKGGQTIFNAKTAGDLLETIKKDARKCGADAIIIKGSEDRAWKPFQGGVTQANSSVLAIRFIKD